MLINLHAERAFMLSKPLNIELIDRNIKFYQLLLDLVYLGDNDSDNQKFKVGLKQITKYYNSSNFLDLKELLTPIYLILATSLTSNDKLPNLNNLRSLISCLVDCKYDPHAKSDNDRTALNIIDELSPKHKYYDEYQEIGKILDKSRTDNKNLSRQLSSKVKSSRNPGSYKLAPTCHVQLTEKQKIAVATMLLSGSNIKHAKQLTETFILTNLSVVKEKQNIKSSEEDLTLDPNFNKHISTIVDNISAAIAKSKQREINA